MDRYVGRFLVRTNQKCTPESRFSCFFQRPLISVIEGCGIDFTCGGSLILIIRHYTVIKTMFMYFVYGSLGHEDGCRCDRNT